MEVLYNSYFSKSGISQKYKGEIPLVPTEDDVKAFEFLNNIKEKISGFVNTGHNLLICSHNVGNGKTSWAIKIAKAYLEYASDYSYEYPPVTFINVPRFLNDKKLAITDSSKQFQINETEKNILNSRLVIFDDIACNGLSEYDKNAIYCWIDHRTYNGLSSIYTSNAEVEDMKKILEPRTFDRVTGLSHKVRLKSGSFRSVEF